MQAKENRLKKMKSLAVVVPTLLDADERRFKFVDKNGFLDDPKQLYLQYTKEMPIWTDAEKAVFRREFINHPKMWHKITPLVPGKSASDCVKYYYLSKKTQNYKKAVRSARKTPGRIGFISDNFIIYNLYAK